MSIELYGKFCITLFIEMINTKYYNYIIRYDKNILNSTRWIIKYEEYFSYR
jgi:hypothetical protein